MPRLTAEAQPGKPRILFEARGRTTVNVRERKPDGSLGYTSGELLLLALANCALGTVMECELVQNSPVEHIVLEMDAPAFGNFSIIVEEITP